MPKTSLNNRKKDSFKIWLGIITAVLLGLFAFFLINSGNAESEEMQLCEAAGGEWIVFDNGCVDSCELARNPEAISCIQALTYGCDCGEDMCWNGETCENN